MPKGHHEPRRLKPTGPEAAKQRRQRCCVASQDILISIFLPATFAFGVAATTMAFLWRRLGRTKSGKHARNMWRGDVMLGTVVPLLWSLATSLASMRLWFELLVNDVRYFKKSEAEAEEARIVELQNAQKKEATQMARPLKRLQRADSVRRVQEKARARRRGAFASPRVLDSGGADDDEEPDIEAHIKQVFEALDEDGSGAIEASEMRVVMSKLGVDLTAEEARDMVRFADQDGDGSIDYEEFQRVLLSGKFEKASYWKVVRSNMSLIADSVVVAMAEEMLRKGFNKIDTSGNGELDYEELRLWLKSFGLQLTKSQARNMVREADADGNGEIDFQEFKLIMSGKELDRARFSASSPWHQVRDLLLKGRSFYLGELAKVNLFDPPEIADLKQRCRAGELSETELEDAMTDYFAGKSTTAQERFQATVSTPRYSLKAAMRKDAEAERDRKAAEAFSGGAITPRSSKGGRGAESLSARLALAKVQKGSGEDEDGVEIEVVDDGFFDSRDMMAALAFASQNPEVFDPPRVSDH